MPSINPSFGSNAGVQKNALEYLFERNVGDFDQFFGQFFGLNFADDGITKAEIDGWLNTMDSPFLGSGKSNIDTIKDLFEKGIDNLGLDPEAETLPHPLNFARNLIKTYSIAQEMQTNWDTHFSEVAQADEDGDDNVLTWDEISSVLGDNSALTLDIIHTWIEAQNETDPDPGNIPDYTQTSQQLGFFETELGWLSDYVDQFPGVGTEENIELINSLRTRMAEASDNGTNITITKAEEKQLEALIEALNAKDTDGENSLVERGITSQADLDALQFVLENATIDEDVTTPGTNPEINQLNDLADVLNQLGDDVFEEGAIKALFKYYLDSSNNLDEDSNPVLIDLSGDDEATVERRELLVGLLNTIRDEGLIDEEGNGVTAELVANLEAALEASGVDLNPNAVDIITEIRDSIQEDNTTLAASLTTILEAVADEKPIPEEALDALQNVVVNNPDEYGLEPQEVEALQAFINAADRDLELVDKITNLDGMRDALPGGEELLKGHFQELIDAILNGELLDGDEETGPQLRRTAYESLEKLAGEVLDGSSSLINQNQATLLKEILEEVEMIEDPEIPETPVSQGLHKMITATSYTQQKEALLRIQQAILTTPEGDEVVIREDDRNILKSLLENEDLSYDFEDGQRPALVEFVDTVEISVNAVQKIGNLRDMLDQYLEEDEDNAMVGSLINLISALAKDEALDAADYDRLRFIANLRLDPDQFDKFDEEITGGISDIPITDDQARLILQVLEEVDRTDAPPRNDQPEFEALRKNQGVVAELLEDLYEKTDLTGDFNNPSDTITRDDLKTMLEVAHERYSSRSTSNSQNRTDQYQAVLLLNQLFDYIAGGEDEITRTELNDALIFVENLSTINLGESDGNANIEQNEIALAQFIFGFTDTYMFNGTEWV